MDVVKEMVKERIDDWYRRATEAYTRCSPVPTEASPEDINKLFQVHNEALKPSEYGRNCDACIYRVWGKVHDHLMRIHNQRLQDSGNDAI